MKELTFTMTMDEAKTMFAGLLELQGKFAHGLIEKLDQQLKVQLAPQPEPETVSDGQDA